MLAVPYLKWSILDAKQWPPDFIDVTETDEQPPLQSWNLFHL